VAEEADRKDEDIALAADGEEDALLGAAAEGDDLDDDAPAPETGLHALGQLGTAVLVVGVLLVIFLAVALAVGWIF
jgi:hypothetical protein